MLESYLIIKQFYRPRCFFFDNYRTVDFCCRVCSLEQRDLTAVFV